MNFFDVTLPTPAENLALDEALLDQAEAGAGGEVLRFWEPEQYFVVLGYANRAAIEVRLSFCREHGVPVLRRTTGGGTVLQGPGALNYTLILQFDSTGPLRSITSTNQFVMERNRGAIQRLSGPEVEIQGHTDLVVEGRKFSGNAQRRKKGFLIFHGSLLLDFDLQRIEQALAMPSKEPTYRGGRSHLDFLTNLRAKPEAVKSVLRESWSANEESQILPQDAVRRLAAEKYSCAEWNLKF
jgi:lipoate-protein ligase A